MEWIKMRGALLGHPRVVAIARLLRANPAFMAWACAGAEPPVVAPFVEVDPGRMLPFAGEIRPNLVWQTPQDRHDGVTDAALLRMVLGGLLLFWSAARAYGKWQGDDLRLEHSTTEDVDNMAGIPGLGAAMKAVGWLTNGDGLTLENFKEFNVPRTDADRARDYRERHRDEAPEATVTKSSRKRHAASRTRVEVDKRRTPVQDEALNRGGVVSPLPPSDRKDLDQPATAENVTLPATIDAAKFWQWWSTRPSRARRVGPCLTGIAHLQAWEKLGQDPNAIVARSYANGWQGLFPLDQRGGGGKQAGIEHSNRAAAEDWLKGAPATEKVAT